MSGAVQAYPLCWPAGWKRTPSHLRRPGHFSKAGTQQLGASSWRVQRPLSVAEALRRVLGELSRMGVDRRAVVVSTNLRVRMDGLPRSDHRMPEDPGAAVYWETRAGERRCMAVDQYTKVEQNLAAIAATLEALRAIERHGGAAILDRAFTGFTSLPPPVPAQRPWRQVLGFDLDYTPSTDDVRAQYRIRRGETHPDREGGSHEAFLAVRSAYEQAAREMGFAP